LKKYREEWEDVDKSDLYPSWSDAVPRDCTYDDINEELDEAVKRFRDPHSPEALWHAHQKCLPYMDPAHK